MRSLDSVGKYFVTILALWLGGCASPLPSQKAQLDRAVSCCANYSMFRYQPLPLGKAVTSRLSGASPVFDFPEGKSFFAAYAITAVFPGGTVYVAGYGAGVAESDATWFYPAVTVLDADFKPIGFSDLGVPIHSGNYWHGDTMIENRVHNVSDKAKYIIVHFPARAKNGRIGGSLRRDSTVQVVNGMAVPGGPSDLTIDIPLSPLGEFKVAVLPVGKDSPDDLPRNTFWYHVTGLEGQ